MIVWKNEKLKKLKIEKKSRMKPFYAGGFTPDNPKFLASIDEKVNHLNMFFLKKEVDITTVMVFNLIFLSLYFVFQSKVKDNSVKATPLKSCTPSSVSKPWNYGVGSSIKSSATSKFSASKFDSCLKDKNIASNFNTRSKKASRKINFQSMENIANISQSVTRSSRKFPEKFNFASSVKKFTRGVKNGRYTSIKSRAVIF